MKKRELILILVSTFIIVVIWVGFNIYHNFVTSTISNNEAIQIAPINPNFDTKTISELKQREMVTPFYNATGSSVVSPTPTPLPIPSVSPAPVSTQSATAASSGGTLNP